MNRGGALSAPLALPTERIAHLDAIRDCCAAIRSGDCCAAGFQPAYVRFGSKADKTSCLDFVRFTPKSGHPICAVTRTRIGDIVELQRPAVFGRPTRLIDMPVSWSLDDAPHFELVRTANWVQQGLMSAPNVLSNWIGDFEYMVRSSDWGVLTYTCHPYCIGRGHRILMLEKLIQRLLELGAVFLQMQTAAVEFDRREPVQN